MFSSCLLGGLAVAVFYLEAVNSVVLKDDAVVALKKSETGLGDNVTSKNGTAMLEGVQTIDDNSELVTNATDLVQESRKQKKTEKGFMERILPMMVMPFMVSSSMIPMMLISLKFLMVKSAVIGAIAITLMLINMFRRRTSGGGVFNHNVNSNDEAMAYYGYHGDEEYGAYVNRRKRR